MCACVCVYLCLCACDYVNILKINNQTMVIFSRRLCGLPRLRSPPPPIPLLRLCLYYACKLLTLLCPATYCMWSDPEADIFGGHQCSAQLSRAFGHVASAVIATCPLSLFPSTPSCCPVAQHFSNFHNNNSKMRSRSRRAEGGQFLPAACCLPGQKLLQLAALALASAVEFPARERSRLH